MKFIDTHSHIYDSAFDADRARTIDAAREAGVERILLPAVDSQSHEAMFGLVRAYPRYCFPMMGLHPTSVNDNPEYMRELELVERLLDDPASVGAGRFCAVGEVGLDLYWSKEWEQQQTEAFRFQIELALRHDLPLAIHTREAWPQMHRVLSEYGGRGIRGVMHAFAGSYEDYCAIKTYGDFLFGIGGVVTYKRSGIAEVLPRMELDDLVLETDAPYLTPVPHRGKRNESAYLGFICDKIGELLGVDSEQVAEHTSKSATRMFPDID